MTEQQIQEYWIKLKALHIRVERNDMWSNVELESRARKQDLAAYDAAYIDLALRKRIPLATSDVNLRTAALAAGVEVLT